MLLLLICCKLKMQDWQHLILRGSFSQHTQCCWSLAASTGYYNYETSGMLMAKESFVWLVAEAAVLRMPLKYCKVILCSLTPLQGFCMGGGRKNKRKSFIFCNITLDSHFWNSSRNLLLGVFLYSSREIFSEC